MCQQGNVSKVFDEQNDYPIRKLFLPNIWEINKIFKEFKSKQYETTPTATGNEERNNNVKKHLLILPYKGQDIMHIISSIRNQVNRALPHDVKIGFLKMKLFSTVNIILCVLF